MTSFQPPSAGPPARPELPEGVWRPPVPPEPPAPPSDRDGLPRWPLWAPFAGMLLTLVIAFVGIAVIAVAIFLARVLDRPVTPGKFGIRLPRLRPAVGWTLLAWVSFVVFSAVWAAALGITENDDLPAELGVEDSDLALVTACFLVCVIAPIAEEVFFRAFCFTALRRALGMVPAAILTGIIFGAIHLGGTDLEFIVPLMVF